MAKNPRVTLNAKELGLIVAALDSYAWQTDAYQSRLPYSHEDYFDAQDRENLARELSKKFARLESNAPCQFGCELPTGVCQGDCRARELQSFLDSFVNEIPGDVAARDSL